jgi:hypothetical protein
VPAAQLGQVGGGVGYRLLSELPRSLQRQQQTMPGHSREHSWHRLQANSQADLLPATCKRVKEERKPGMKEGPGGEGWELGATAVEVAAAPRTSASSEHPPAPSSGCRVDPALAILGELFCDVVARPAHGNCRVGASHAMRWVAAARATSRQHPLVHGTCAERKAMFSEYLKKWQHTERDARQLHDPILSSTHM